MWRMAGLSLAVAMALSVLFLQSASSATAQSSSASAATPNCKSQDNVQAGFAPRAHTLMSVYVRTKAPEYSFVKGQWAIGDTQGILKPGTCLQILKREEIGVIQVWYWIRYLDFAGQIRTGWVWAGTKNKDEGSYIGGDTAPSVTSQQFPEVPATDPLAWFASAAYAQGDTVPVPRMAENETMSPKPPVADAEYLVEIPLIGLSMSGATASAVVLFVIMLMGMIAKAIWDQIDSDGKIRPAKGKIVRPLLISPIAFSAFWGPMYVQQGGGLSLTMALYAFQIGFMWQHVLEKRIGSDGK